MKLKSFGCSFIYGSELSDDNHGSLYFPASNLTWPALLSKDLGYEYSCYARPGSGNLQILEHLLNQLNDRQTLYIVGWTWIDRFDYQNSLNNNWRTITPSDTTNRAEFYYKNLHNQYVDKLNSLVAIKTAIDILDQKNCPFIMTYIDDLIFESRWHSTPAVAELQNYVRPHMTSFNGKDFLNWSKENDFPIGAQGNHPLEEAHCAAFQLIKSYNLI